MRLGGERGRAEHIEGWAAQGGPLDRQFERFAFYLDHRVAKVVPRLLPGAGIPARFARPPVSPGTLARRLAPRALAGTPRPGGDPVRPPVGTARALPCGLLQHPGAHEFLVQHAQPPIEADRVPVAEAAILDPADDPGGSVQRGK